VTIRDVVGEKGDRRRDIREGNRRSEYDQSMLYACMEM
jgi:hypothetical protein